MDDLEKKVVEAIDYVRPSLQNDGGDIDYVRMEGNKVFVKGRVQVEEDKDAKLICQDIKSFDDCPQRVWIQLESKAGYEETEKKLAGIIKEMDGKDVLVIYFKQEKEIKVMPANWCLAATSENLAVLKEVFGDDNVRTVAGKVEFAKSKRWQKGIISRN